MVVPCTNFNNLLTFFQIESMFVISIMETFHNHAEDLSQNSLSDLDIWGRLIEYRKEVQWDNILDQVEELESKFDRSKTWEKFVNKPVIDQYGQVWMIWKSGDCYQIYKMPDDKDEFDYVFIDDLEVTPTLGEPIYKFSVGFDNFGEAELLHIITSDKTDINKTSEYCHLFNYEREKWESHRRWMKYDNDSYSSMEELRKIYERYEKWLKKQGNNSFNAKEIFGKIYDNYGGIQQKLAEASIINSLNQLSNDSRLNATIEI
mgnify:CR=1 FL=1